MRFLPVSAVIAIVALFAACDVLPGAGSDGDGSEPSGSPTSFELSGKVSMRFTLSDVHTCEDLLLADLPRPETEEEVTATIRHREAQTQIDLITDRSVSIFDATEGAQSPTTASDDEVARGEGHLATVSTDDEITATEIDAAASSPGTVECAASTSFNTVLPPADSYRFVVRGVPGDPKPVAYEACRATASSATSRSSLRGASSNAPPAGSRASASPAEALETRRLTGSRTQGPRSQAPSAS